MYIVEKTNGQILAEVADKTINTSACSLNLVGRGAKNYGDPFAENFVHLLENFANNTAPPRALPGQFWYNTGTKLMKFWDGIAWRDVGNVGECLGFTRANGSRTSITGVRSLTFTRSDGTTETLSNDAGLPFSRSNGLDETISGVECGGGDGGFGGSLTFIYADGTTGTLPGGGIGDGGTGGTGGTGDLTRTEADTRYLRLSGGTVTGNTYVNGGMLVAGTTTVASDVLNDTTLLVNGRLFFKNEGSPVVMSAKVGVSNGRQAGSLGTGNAYPLTFWTNSWERMTITENGDVGIGTTSPTAGTPDSATYPSKVLEVRGRIRSATGPIAINSNQNVAVDIHGAKDPDTGKAIAALGTSSKHALSVYLNSANHFRFSKLTATGSSTAEDLTLADTGGPSLMFFGKPLPASTPELSSVQLSNYPSDSIVATITAWQLPRINSADPASGAPTFDIGTYSSHPVRIRCGGYIAMGWNPTTFDTYAYGNNAYKPNGGSWTALSDQRLKTDIRAFDLGLDAVVSLTPRLFKYKNNVGMYTDVRDAPQNDFVGLVAQEANATPMAPWIVGSTKSTVIPGEEPVDVLTVDSTAITYALINAVKELNAKVASLEAQIAALTND